MKKLLTVILLAAMALTMLAGCEDATAKVSNANEMIMKIGKTTYTKGQLYEAMMEDDAVNTVVTKALQMIADAEIETTDEIKTEAQEMIDDYKEQIAETTDEPFEEAIKMYGYDSLEAFEEYCLLTTKSSHLLDKYIEENWDSLLEEYAPVKAKMIYVSGADGAEEGYKKAEEALEALKSGQNFEEVAEAYTSNKNIMTEKLYTRKDSSLDYNVLQYLTTVSAPGLSQVITNKDVNGYYVVQVTNINQTQLKDDFIALLKDDTDFSDTVISHFFKLHNFTVYDIDVFNEIKENYPAYLVQTNGPKD